MTGRPGREDAVDWTGARYAECPVVQVRISIAATPAEVWPLVSDPVLMAELSDELQEVEWVEGTGPAVGARFRGRSAHPAIGEWRTTSTVIECAPPHVFAWAVEDPAEPSATWRFTLEAHDGGTVLTQWARMGPGRSGLSRAIEAMPDKEQKIVFGRLREWERGMRANLAELKRRAEARS